MGRRDQSQRPDDDSSLERDEAFRVRIAREALLDLLRRLREALHQQADPGRSIVGGGPAELQRPGFHGPGPGCVRVRQVQGHPAFRRRVDGTEATHPCKRHGPRVLADPHETAALKAACDPAHLTEERRADPLAAPIRVDHAACLRLVVPRHAGVADEGIAGERELVERLVRPARLVELDLHVEGLGSLADLPEALDARALSAADT